MKKLRNNLGFIFSSIKRYDRMLLIILLINNFVMLLSIIIPIILPRYIIDELMEGRDYYSVLRYVFIFAVTTIGTSSATYLFKSSIYIRSMTIRFKLIVESGKKYLAMDYMNFENPEILDLSERGDRATENNASGIEGVMHKFATFGGNLLIFITLAIIIIAINPWIALLCLGSLAVNYYVAHRAGRYEKKIQDGLSQTNRKWNYIVNMLSDTAYYKDIYIFKMQDVVLSKLSLLNKKKCDGYRVVRNKNNIKDNIVSLLSSMQEIVIYIAFATQVFSGSITIGEYTMFVASVHTFYSMASQLVSDVIFILLQNERISDFRAFLDLDLDENSINHTPIPDDIQSIEFNNVNFKYCNEKGYAVRNLNVKINKDEKIAIVGLNGAGKTTFIKLLAKLYEPSEGTIYFNRKNIGTMDRYRLYEKFSVVFQESNLFAFTLAENISMKPLNKTDIGKVHSCLERVGLHIVVEKLPQKCLQPVLKVVDDEGVEFSGGEIHKLSLARALYKDAPIMILDEPMASYDALSEERIYKMFNDLTKDKTVFYISHRLASTRFCDRIFMFEDGEMVEQGTHDELLQRNGRYAHLFNVQSHYYREDADAI